MARKNPVSPEGIAVAKRLLALRETMKISRTDFAALLGMSMKSLEHREVALTPWQPQEITAAKARIVAQQNDVSLALDALES